MEDREARAIGRLNAAKSLFGRVLVERDDGARSQLGGQLPTFLADYLSFGAPR